MVLCDTNIFIYAFNGRKEAIDSLQNIGLDNVVISSITVMELLQGMRNKIELAQTKKNICYFDIIEINLEISKLATHFIEKYNLSHGLLIPDALIGATAVIHQIPLYTYNTKDFKFMPNLQLF